MLRLVKLGIPSYVFFHHYVKYVKRVNLHTFYLTSHTANAHSDSGVRMVGRGL